MLFFQVTTLETLSKFVRINTGISLILSLKLGPHDIDLYRILSAQQRKKFVLFVRLKICLKVCRFVKVSIAFLYYLQSLASTKWVHLHLFNLTFKILYRRLHLPSLCRADQFHYSSLIKISFFKNVFLSIKESFSNN